MFLSITTPEHLYVQPNSLRIKAGLTSGVAEIYDKHQNLAGRIENDFLEVYSFNENKEEKSLYLLQNAIFVVNNENLEEEEMSDETSVFVYAKKLIDLSKNISLDSLESELKEKNENLKEVIQKLKLENSDENNFELLRSKALIFQEDILFLEKACSLIKEKAK